MWAKEVKPVNETNVYSPVFFRVLCTIGIWVIAY